MDRWRRRVRSDSRRAGIACRVSSSAGNFMYTVGGSLASRQVEDERLDSGGQPRAVEMSRRRENCQRYSSEAGGISFLHCAIHFVLADISVFDHQPALSLARDSLLSLSF